MAYDQEDAIVVNPPQELETNNESETVQVDGPRGTANARTETEPQEQRTYTFTKHDIKAIADEALQEAIDKGEFDDIVEANPTLEGSEPDLESLKVGSTKYKVGGGTEVIANPTLAGSEPDLTSVQIGEDKFVVPPRVSANPTLAGTEDALTGLQIGNTKFKAGGGSKIYEHKITTQYSSSNSVKVTKLSDGSVVTVSISIPSGTTYRLFSTRSTAMSGTYGALHKIISCSGRINFNLGSDYGNAVVDGFLIITSNQYNSIEVTYLVNQVFSYNGEIYLAHSQVTLTANYVTDTITEL